jgi:hypothetical protein
MGSVEVSVSAENGLPKEPVLEGKQQSFYIEATSTDKFQHSDKDNGSY